jgi:hypothetical protein
LGLLSPTIPSFNGIGKTQYSRVIVVVLQVGAMEIYVVAVEELRKNERQDETQFTIKIGRKTSFGPSYFIF